MAGKDPQKALRNAPSREKSQTSSVLVLREQITVLKLPTAPSCSPCINLMGSEMSVTGGEVARTQPFLLIARGQALVYGCLHGRIGQHEIFTLSQI